MMERRYKDSLSNQTPDNEETMKNIVFIPYNKKWGMTTINGKILAAVSENGKGITSFDFANSHLKQAVVECLGSSVLKRGPVKYVTFDITYSEDKKCNLIDKTSFQIFSSYPQQLGDLKTANVFLEIDVFIAPDEQRWISESVYRNYASHGNFVYECSDGTLTTSYDDFKAWETELTVNPNNPNFSVLPYDKSLSDIEHVIESDGTVWRNNKLLKEYLAWKKNHNNNYISSYYCGIYGMANSFAEYIKLYNASYFAQLGLKRSEQHMDISRGLMFASKEEQLKYKSVTKQAQKIK